MNNSPDAEADEIQTLSVRLRPVIYVPKELPGYELAGVLYESHKCCGVLWYHWPADDATGKPDYEPVILLFAKGQLAAIGTRPHTEYKDTDRWLVERGRPIIVFEFGWHAPKIYRGRVRDALTAAFTHPMVSKPIRDYSLTPGKPPQWYVKDDASISVYDYADQMIQKYSPTNTRKGSTRLYV